MRLDPHHFWSLYHWLFAEKSLLYGVALLLTMSILGFVICFIVAMVRQGPGEGFLSISKAIHDLFVVDLPKTRLFRVWAIAKLAFLEAVRRKVLVVIAIFIVIILFAGWFLDRSAEDPAKLYISFVLTATNYMVLLLGLFLSAFSLPADIKNRTIYTIVTKPVRATEIVLGRIVGFALIGSVILTVLGALSYVFVVRGLRHSHEVQTVSQDGKSGTTDTAASHLHRFRIGADGNGVTDEVKGHQHEINVVDSNGQKRYIVGPPTGNLNARVPIYGTLVYTDRNGQKGGGINVGYMSEYRKFIAGGSLSSAIWTFENLHERDFPDGLQLEMNIEAFRTYKGDIVTPVRGSLILRAPDETAESERLSFLVKESLDRKLVKLELPGFKLNQPAKVKLFGDLVIDGKLQIIIRCEDSQQYLGMAAADLAINARDSTFMWNFFKGYISIWIQMVIVICFGVMYSTFLSGPVAMIATLSSLVLGFFGGNIDSFFKDTYAGGGPVEAMVRIVTQRGTMLDLDLGNAALESTIKNIDYGVMSGVLTLKSAVPDFGKLYTSDFIAYGIDLFDGLLLRHIFIGLGYFLMTTIIGYFFLKSRELAA